MREMKDSGIEWIGEIPEEWRLTRIGYLFKTIGSGTTPSSSDSRYYDGNHNWLQTGDLNDGIIITTEKTVTDLAIEKHSVLRQYSIGSLVVAMYGATIGKLGLLNIPCYTNQACCVLEEPINVDTKYVYYWLFCNRQNLITFSLGGGQPNISQNTIREFKICLPSKIEQESIVSYLDTKCAEIDALIAAKEKTNALLREYRQSVIYEAVTKGLDPNAPVKDSGVEWIGEIPANWTPIRLKYVINSIESGTSVNAEDHPCGKNEYGVLKTSCVLTGQFQSDQNKTVLTEEYSRLSCPVRKDSVIVSRMNTPNLVGACGYVENDHPNLFLPDRLWQVSFRLNCLSKYMWYFLSSEYTKAIYASICTGTSGSMQNISQEQFGDIIFFLPSINEQATIVRTLDTACEQIDSIIEDNSSCISQLKEYRQSLIYEAVTGKTEV